LSFGQQAAQIIHAVVDYCSKHDYKEWMEVSNYVVVLCAPDEEHLEKILEKAISRDLSVGFFREPDLDDQLTAIVLEPGPRGRKLCSSLPLLKG
jgi:peptidyl-tRNA hydrolase